jgi:hypothetical protein
MFSRSVVDTINVDYVQPLNVEYTKRGGAPLMKHWKRRKKKYPLEPILKQFSLKPEKELESSRSKDRGHLKVFWV